jgi:hypothetical protein
MAGGLIQLVALGTQDTKLTKDPQISFFKSSYRPYVNFAMEAISQSITGQTDFGKSFQVELSRSGDLVLDFLLEMTLPQIQAHQGTAPTFNGSTVITSDGSTERVQWVDNIANTMVKSVALNIGGQDIDKHYSEWFSIWNELTLAEEKRAGYNDLIGQQNLVEVSTVGAYDDNTGALVTDYSQNPGTVVSARDPEAPYSDFRSRFSTGVTYKYQGLQTPKVVHPATKVQFMPQFWFNNNPGLALPLIALQYHQVRVKFDIRPLSELYVLSSNDQDASGLRLEESRLALGDVKFWVNYVFLEAAERRVTAKKSHEYLITQLQTNDGESVNAANHRAKLSFNHPCMELIWAVREDEASNANRWNDFETYRNTFLYSAGTVNSTNSTSAAKTFIRGLNPVTSLKLQIHGQDRFDARDGDYFNRYQPYLYHSRVPKSRGIGVYSFALNPESRQPNGTANFSRIDNPNLLITFAQISSANVGRLFVYARNVNLFRVAGGMGGVSFAS